MNHLGEIWKAEDRKVKIERQEMEK